MNDRVERDIAIDLLAVELYRKYGCYKSVTPAEKGRDCGEVNADFCLECIAERQREAIKAEVQRRQQRQATILERQRERAKALAKERDKLEGCVLEEQVKREIAEKEIGKLYKDMEQLITESKDLEAQVRDLKVGVWTRDKVLETACKRLGLVDDCPPGVERGMIDCNKYPCWQCWRDWLREGWKK